MVLTTISFATKPVRRATLARQSIPMGEKIGATTLPMRPIKDFSAFSAFFSVISSETATSRFCANNALSDSWVASISV